MGTADAVPGVSGGTVALVCGVYDELITALSSFDRTWFRLLRQGDWRAAAERIHLLFLLRLACGIAIGLFAALLTVAYLFENDSTRPFTLAVFFGMILASTLIVMGMIDWQSTLQRLTSVSLILVGAAFSYWLTTLPAMQPDKPSLVYLFLCGAIAICAMILPGISGSLMLIVLGVYHHLSGLPRLLIGGDNISTILLEITAFGLGCLTGLLGFSKLLRYLLTGHQPLTMSVLCGVMFGTLNILWPFQEPAEGKDVLRNVLPALDLQTGAIILTVLASALLVLWIDRRFKLQLVQAEQPTASDSETSD